MGKHSPCQSATVDPIERRFMRRHTPHVDVVDRAAIAVLHAKLIPPSGKLDADVQSVELRFDPEHALDTGTQIPPARTRIPRPTRLTGDSRLRSGDVAGHNVGFASVVLRVRPREQVGRSFARVGMPPLRHSLCVPPAPPSTPHGSKRRRSRARPARSASDNRCRDQAACKPGTEAGRRSRCKAGRAPKPSPDARAPRRQSRRGRTMFAR